MKTDNEISGLRHRIVTPFGNSYLFVAENDVLLTVPDENKPEQRELRATTEAICRIASKAMAAGLPMKDIAEQLIKSDAGRSTILSEIAAKMLEFCDKNVARK